MPQQMRGSASGAPSTSTPTSHPRSRCSSGARGMFRGCRRKPLSTSSLCWPKATLNNFIHAFHCRSVTHPRPQVKPKTKVAAARKAKLEEHPEWSADSRLAALSHKRKSIQEQRAAIADSIRKLKEAPPPPPPPQTQTQTETETATATPTTESQQEQSAAAPQAKRTRTQGEGPTTTTSRATEQPAPPQLVLMRQQHLNLLIALETNFALITTTFFSGIMMYDPSSFRPPTLVPSTTTTFVTNRFDNLEGGYYTGRLVNNQMDGRGTCRYHTPLDNYDGQWFQGVKEGRGKYTWADGTTYDGQWAKGEKEGWGVLAKPNGGRYEGMWKAGHWSSGTYWFEDGVTVYEGEWTWDQNAEENLRHGRGVLRRRVVALPAATPATVTAETVPAARTTATGSNVAIGRLPEKALHHRRSSSSESHSGSESEGETQCTCSSCMVTVYEGEWYRDMVHGTGTLYSPTGNVYIGKFECDKRSGRGTMTFSGGGWYSGLWKNDLFHGHGERVWSCGDRYEGQWEEGVEHGEGTKVLAADGSTLRGFWERGVSMRGTQTWPNGDQFEGKFTQQSGGKDWDGEGSMTIPKQERTAKFQGILQHRVFKGCNGVSHTMGTQEMHFGPQMEELNMMFKLAVQFQFQIQATASELVVLVDSLAKVKHCLQVTTEQNAALEEKLQALTKKKNTLAAAHEECEVQCNNVLGKSLTIQSSESEIQQCSSNILALTRKFLRTKCTDSKLVVPSKDTQNLPLYPQTFTFPNTVKYGSASYQAPAPAPPTVSLVALTSTLLKLQEFQLTECNRLIAQHAVISKECTEQSDVCHQLQQDIEGMKLSCGKLDETYKHMFMLKRGLEGDESFMSHPVVWAELSELLPASQQALIALVLEQKASSTSTLTTTDALSSSTALQSGTTTATTQSQQPGCTAPVSIGPQQVSSDANQTLPCIVCDERPRNIRLHPCGHGVLCTECAALVRKCPFCRDPIQEKQKLFL
ncbi:TIR protein [Pelomyxa schiedti]|nr:TIR protein [Pelomyxa schiedti]